MLITLLTLEYIAQHEAEHVKTTTCFLKSDQQEVWNNMDCEATTNKAPNSFHQTTFFWKHDKHFRNLKINIKSLHFYFMGHLKRKKKK